MTPNHGFQDGYITCALETGQAKREHQHRSIRAKLAARMPSDFGTDSSSSEV